MMRVGSLFSGIGGIDLGLERAGMRTVWFAEIDPYASRVLKKHWPDVPNHGDITRIDFTAVKPVDLLCGGFPCQDISNAGKRAGIDGERSGLWGEYVRAIRELRPRYVFVENVSALLARGVDRVLGDLASLGYNAEWECIPASAVGAPHRRDRVWLVAYAHCKPKQCGLFGGGVERGEAASSARAVDANDPGGCGHGSREPDVADANGRKQAGRGHTSGVGRKPELGPRVPGVGAWAPEPEVGRVADGVPARVDRLRGLGNAVVPQVAELIGGWIMEHARSRSRANQQHQRRTK